MRKILLFIAAIAFAAGCAGSSEARPGNTSRVVPETNNSLSGANTFRLDAWADNWFAAYLGDKLIVELVFRTSRKGFEKE